MSKKRTDEQTARYINTASADARVSNNDDGRRIDHCLCVNVQPYKAPLSSTVHHRYFEAWTLSHPTMMNEKSIETKLDEEILHFSQPAGTTKRSTMELTDLNVIAAMYKDWHGVLDARPDHPDAESSASSSPSSSTTEGPPSPPFPPNSLELDETNGRVAVFRPTTPQSSSSAIANNNISYLSPRIGCLDALRVLNLSRMTALTTLPTEIGHLQQLETLVLDETAVTTLPSQVGNLSQLRYLSVHGCSHLTTLPTCIRRLSNTLHSLDVSLRYLNDGLPEWIGELTSLEELDFDCANETCQLNTKSYVFPASLAGLHQLRQIRLDADCVKRLPDECFHQWTNLKEVFITFDEAEKDNRRNDVLAKLSRWKNLERLFVISVKNKQLERQEQEEQTRPAPTTQESKVTLCGFPNLSFCRLRWFDNSARVTLMCEDLPQLTTVQVFGVHTLSMVKSSTTLPSLTSVSIAPFQGSNEEGGDSNNNENNNDDDHYHQACGLSFNDLRCPALEKLYIFPSPHLESRVTFPSYNPLRLKKLAMTYPKLDNDLLRKICINVVGRCPNLAELYLSYEGSADGFSDEVIAALSQTKLRVMDLSSENRSLWQLLEDEDCLPSTASSSESSPTDQIPFLLKILKACPELGQIDAVVPKGCDDPSMTMIQKSCLNELKANRFRSRLQEFESRVVRAENDLRLGLWPNLLEQSLKAFRTYPWDYSIPVSEDKDYGFEPFRHDGRSSVDKDMNQAESIFLCLRQRGVHEIMGDTFLI